MTTSFITGPADSTAYGAFWRLLPSVADETAGHVVRAANAERVAVAVLGPHDAGGTVAGMAVILDREGNFHGAKRHSGSRYRDPRGRDMPRLGYAWSSAVVEDW